MNGFTITSKAAARRCFRALPACAAAALVLAGVAGAANSGSFADITSDVRKAPDIYRLDVSNDDAGTLTFQVTIGPGRAVGLAGDELGVALDVDQNPDTGSVYYGTEVAITYVQRTLTFYRAGRGELVKVAPPASLQGLVGPSMVTFTVSASDLGLGPTDGFNVLALSSYDPSGEMDNAPNIRTFNYQQVAGTAPKPLGSDTRAPRDLAFPSRGVHGRVAQLFYWAADGRGKTADTIRVYRRNRLLRTIHIPLGDANPFLVYYVSWRVPRAMRGRLRFCVRSTDAARNRSNLSCARLTVK